jgi:ribosome recycling factor
MLLFTRDLLIFFHSKTSGENMIKESIAEAEKRMKSAITALEEDLAGVRTGRASPALIEKMQIEYYGTTAPLIQLATISVPEPRQLLIRPFDINSIKEIERAILASELGLNPLSDGKVIRLNLPPLNEERRRDLTKYVHSRLEDSHIAIRNVRRDIIKELREYEDAKLLSKDDLATGEEEIQKLTDRLIEEIDSIGEKKVKEIMEV